jgi:uncharacterized cupredoxin-like copper-binding protein
MPRNIDFKTRRSTLTFLTLKKNMIQITGINQMFRTITLPLLACMFLVGNVFAHENMGNHNSTQMTQEQFDWGTSGDAKKVDRTITISMTDNMRFTPEKINVKLNETVNFVVMNNGKVLHEFVIGTQTALAQHAKMMEKFPGMEHDSPYMAHVNTGKGGQVIWNFNRLGQFEFACLLPGHFQAGMKGTIVVN